MTTTPRLTPRDRVMLRAMGFNHVVFIAKDVSVEVPGSVQSAFRKSSDAWKEAERLSAMYEHDQADGFSVAVV